MNTNNNCFFRTLPSSSNFKALLQITERCNLKCLHCFLSANDGGVDISLKDISIIIPKLKSLNVKKVTITGGEPFLHNDLVEICNQFVNNGFMITICTNGTLITDDLIFKLSCIKNIKFNISLDGFSKFAVENFRGRIGIFDDLIQTIKKLSSLNLVKGLIVTPNTFADYHEYTELCMFAKSLGINYVIINPLSEFGRGIKSKNSISTNLEVNNKIKNETQYLISNDFDIKYIRLNTESLPLGKCNSNKLLYILANGDVYNCPYLFFASSNPNNLYNNKDFLLGNIIHNPQIKKITPVIDSFLNTTYNRNTNCKTCNLHNDCKFGCPAMIIANGQSLNSIDYSICPITLKEI